MSLILMSLITERQTKRILVVDDVADNVFLAQFVLETQGYQVNTAESGETALALIQTEALKPDLIILDLMMPGINGYEVIDRLRNLQDLPYIPVLLMTANQDVSCQQAKEAGADRLLYKPFDLEQFLTTVELFDI
ncbi:MAG: response regulator [Cyanobacteria bacterium J06607_15]